MATYTGYHGNPDLANYNASRFVRYARNGTYCSLAIFDPPAVGFSGPRPVMIYWPPGANQAKASWDVGANAIMSMFTDDLGGYVVIADGHQGGHYLEAVEEADMLFGTDLWAETALVNMFLRANCENAAVVGATYTIAPEPRYWCMYGTSAGAWRIMGSQLVPRGDWGDMVDALAMTGDSQYGYDYDHTANHIFCDSLQAQLETFHECRTATAAAYQVDGAHASGVSSIAIDTGTGTFYRGNRVTFGADAQQYAVTADLAAAGTLTIWPPLISNVANNAAVAVVPTGQETFEEDSWAVGYTGTKSDGRVGRSDDASGRGVPLIEKLHVSPHYLVRDDNPRVNELNIMLYRNNGGSLHVVNSLTATQSFWGRRNQTALAALPEHTSLHDEGDAAFFAHKFYVTAGNTDNIHAYIGEPTSSNPTGTDDSVPWLKGDNDVTFIHLKLRSFLRDADRAGGDLA